MIDPYNFISYNVWLSLPNETRYKIAALFHIEPRGTRQTIMEHRGGTVISDGFLHSDLAVITKESMKEITGFESNDFNACFQILVDKVEGKLNNTTDVQQKEPEKVNAGTESKAHRGRPSRKV